MITASKLRTPIVIEALVESYDEIGQPVNEWETIITTFANVRHLSGSEAIKADASVSITKTSIIIRYRAGITPAMRVIGPHGIYHIEAVLPNKHNGEMTLVCERVA